MAKLSIQDLAKVLVDKNGLSLKQSEQFVASMFDVVRQGLERDNLVKIKGLGTFKIIGVEARESVNVNTGERVLIDSHAKVTFSPDNTMKEMVNKPFSQFETVVLNDGVDFEDMGEQADDDSLPERDNTGYEISAGTVVGSEEPVVEKEEPVVDTEEPIADNEEPIADMEEQIAGEYPVADDGCLDNPPLEDVVLAEPLLTEPATIVDGESEQADDSCDMANEENSGNIEEDDVVKTKSDGWKWIIFSVLSAILVLVSAYIGYRYGVYQTELEYAARIPLNTTGDKVVKKTAKPLSQKKMAGEVNKDSASNAIRRDTISAASEKKKPDGENGGKEIKETEAFDYSKYEDMDVRVRTGAYRIAGTEKVVKVNKNETLEDISKKYLGPGMVCYLEVYNGLSSDAALKEGQQIKLPKLELKRKRVRKQ